MVYKFIIIFSLCLFVIVVVNAALSENSDKNTSGIVQPEPQSVQTESTIQSRGQMLYENHCRECHESAVHIRNGKRVKSRDDILYWVNRWSNELKLHWNAQDMEQVANHLESNFYHF